MSEWLESLRALRYLAQIYGPDDLILAWGAILAAVVSAVISIAITLLTAPNLKGPRQKDQGIQTGEYGQPIPIVYGPQNRLAGSVIWYSGLNERKQKEGGSGGSATTYTYSCSVAVLLAEARPGREYVGVRRVWANRKLIYNGDDPIFDVAGQLPQYFASLAFYPGSSTQDPDSTIETYEGVGDVPAYPHWCYVVVKDLELADFGPILPNLEFELIADDEISVIDCIEDIASRSGVTIDTDDLVGNTGNIAGYAINAEVSPSEALAPLAAAYFFDIAEQGGNLKCVPRGMKARATIPIEDTGATANGEASQRTIEYERAPDAEVPQEVSVSYYDYARDLEVNTARARYESGNYDANTSVTIPLTLTPTQALAIAQRILWGLRFMALKAKLTVSEKWIGIVPGDVVLLESPRGNMPFLLTKATRGADGVIAWELQYEDSLSYPETVPLASDYTPGSGPAGPGEAVTQFLDVPIFRDSQDDAGFFVVVSGAGAEFAGATILRSTDGGTDYDRVSDVIGGGTIGDVTGSPPSGPTDVWDRATTIRVTLTDTTKELDSISELSVYNGGNTCWMGPESGVGGEVFQFATATLVSTGVYDLTNLLRGRRGTEWAVGLHSTGEKFVYIADSANLVRLDFGAVDWDAERLYKGVSLGLNPDDVTAIEFTNGGEGKRCWSPTHLVGRWNSSSDLSVEWFRRTRRSPTGFGGITPLGESDETYQLDFYEPHDTWVIGTVYAEGTLLRHQSVLDYGWYYYRARSSHTANANNEPNRSDNNYNTRWRTMRSLRTVHLADRSAFTYTAAMQTSDGHTPGAALEIQCRQRSGSRGYGHPALSFA